MTNTTRLINKATNSQTLNALAAKIKGWQMPYKNKVRHLAQIQARRAVLPPPFAAKQKAA